MRKTSLFLMLSLLLINFSCKENSKQDETIANQVEQTKTQEVVYQLTPDKTTLTWTAYKTTDKMPVKGTFKTLKFEDREGKDPKELFQELDFSIPVSSLFTNDATGTRDPKILAFFFEKMDNTDLITGKIKLENEELKAQIKMNNQTHDLPLNYSISDKNVVTLTGTMHLEDWDALKALASLNEACFDLHKGGDGVSKTWEDVALEIKATL